MSLIDGGLEIRRLLNKNPNMSPEEAAKRLRRGPIQDAVLDFDNAVKAVASFGWSPFQPSPERGIELRTALRHLILGLKPVWGSLIPRGRKEVLALLSDDELQCFEAAGLTEKPPSEEVLTWWDEISSLVQRSSSNELLRVGRLGERLTLEYERERLKREGLGHLHPEWVAIENTSLGYDVLSWYINPDGDVSRRLIEVKTCISKTNRFFLTRNEWHVARANSLSYVIYFWRGDPLELELVLPATKLARFIPDVIPAARWVSIEVFVDKLIEQFRENNREQ